MSEEKNEEKEKGLSKSSVYLPEGVAEHVGSYAARRKLKYSNLIRTIVTEPRKGLSLLSDYIKYSLKHSDEVDLDEDLQNEIDWKEYSDDDVLALADLKEVAEEAIVEATRRGIWKKEEETEEEEG